jgi:hypothetical protein
LRHPDGRPAVLGCSLNRCAPGWYRRHSTAKSSQRPGIPEYQTDRRSLSSLSDQLKLGTLRKWSDRRLGPVPRCGASYSAVEYSLGAASCGVLVCLPGEAAAVRRCRHVEGARARVRESKAPSRASSCKPACRGVQFGQGSGRVGGVERAEAERTAWGVNSEVKEEVGLCHGILELGSRGFWFGGVRVKRS